jgi:hypothetical protein
MTDWIEQEMRRNPGLRGGVSNFFMMETRTMQAKKVFARTGLVALVALLALAVICLWDEPLSPVSEQAFHYQVPPVPPEENAFIALAGLSAPAGSDFIRVGEERVRLLAQGIVPPPDEASLWFRETPSGEKAENIRQQSEENRELMERYLKITSLPVYANVFVNDILMYSIETFNYPLENDHLANASQFLTTLALLDIQEGRIAEGLAKMATDQALLRRIYAAKEADYVNKITALQRIRVQTMLLGQLIAQNALRDQTEKARALLTPLENPKEHYLEMRWREHVYLWRDRDFGRRETPEIIRALWKRMNGGEGDEEMGYAQKLRAYFMYYFLYKENMTRNLDGEFLNHEIALINETPLSRLASERKILPGKIRERACGKAPEDSFACKHPWRNYVGEFRFRHLPTAGLTTNRLFEIYDVDAAIRLTRAQLEYQLAVKNHKGAPADVPQVLATLGPETFNPYTEQPFEWNPEKGSISFQPAESVIIGALWKDRERVEAPLRP